MTDVTTPGPAADLAIDIRGLVRTVRDPMSQRQHTVLNGIDLSVARGEVFGFLGVNGAGKTTTLQCLVGLARPNAGTLRVLGSDPALAETRRRIGFLPERPYFYDYLNAFEFLDLMGQLCDLDAQTRKRRIDELLTQFHMTKVAKTPLRKLSKGELQRLGVAQAVIHDPDVIIFDEPMSGLDPHGRRDVRDMISRASRQGKTVLFSSHVVPDVEAICDRVAVLHRGEILSCGKIEEITSVRLRQVNITVRGVSEELVARLVSEADAVETIGESIKVKISDSAQVDRLIVRVVQAGGQIMALERRRERLEEYLVRTTETEEEVAA